MSTKAFTTRATNRSWMKELVAHYQQARLKNPDDLLLVLFDIDGTILDMRYAVLHVLRWFDHEHGTSHFRSLTVDSVSVHENEVDLLLRRLNLGTMEHERVTRWYQHHLWSSPAVYASHRPFQGVLEVIRWFQLQERTFVALNTGRPEKMRAVTLNSLNALGKEFRVHFSDDLLHMSPSFDPGAVVQAKRQAIHHFRNQGYRVVAMIDNEPENLAAIVEDDPAAEILLLHADTIFASKRSLMPRRAITGSSYDLAELFPEEDLPRHVQLVWHRLNDRDSLERFLRSDIHWGEVDLRLHPLCDLPILRHDSFWESPLEGAEELIYLKDVLPQFLRAGKGIKLDLKEDGLLVGRVLELVEIEGFGDRDLWFNGDLETLGERGLREIASRHPGAILQVPIDFLAPLILAMPGKAQELLSMLSEWGVNRLSFGWKVRQKAELLDRLDDWGYETNIYGIPGFEAFLQAVLLSPRSITSKFDFAPRPYGGNLKRRARHAGCGLAT